MKSVWTMENRNVQPFTCLNFWKMSFFNDCLYKWNCFYATRNCCEWTLFLRCICFHFYSEDLNIVFELCLKFKLPPDFFFLSFVFGCQKWFFCLKIDETLSFFLCVFKFIVCFFEMADYVIINDSGFLLDGTTLSASVFSLPTFVASCLSTHSFDVSIRYRCFLLQPILMAMNLSIT